MVKCDICEEVIPEGEPVHRIKFIPYDNVYPQNYCLCLHCYVHFNKRGKVLPYEG